MPISIRKLYLFLKSKIISFEGKNKDYNLSLSKIILRNNAPLNCLHLIIKTLLNNALSKNNFEIIFFVNI